MDQDAFRAFYAASAPRLRAYIARSCGSRELADDILQETFIRFLGHQNGFSDDTGQRAFLYRTAKNLLIDAWRKRERERIGIGEMQVLVEHRQVDAMDEVSGAFRQLSHRDQSLLWLAYVEGMDHREIATVAGVKPKSVRVLLFRARQALAAFLDLRKSSMEVR